MHLSLHGMRCRCTSLQHTTTRNVLVEFVAGIGTGAASATCRYDGWNCSLVDTPLW